MYPITPNNFLCIRDANMGVITSTFFYLKYIPATRKRYERVQAHTDIITPYLGDTKIIKLKEYYYFDHKTQTIPVGWHGSVDPPIDIDAWDSININEEF